MNKNSFECMMLNAELKDAHMNLVDDLRNLKEVGAIMESCQLGLDFLNKCDSKAAVETLHDIDRKLIAATATIETLSDAMVAAWNKFVDFIKGFMDKLRALFSKSIPMQIANNNKCLLELKQDVKLLAHEGVENKVPPSAYADIVEQFIKWNALGAEAIEYLHKVNSSVTAIGKIICTGYGIDVEKQMSAVIFGKDSYLQKVDDVFDVMLSIRDGIKESARSLGKVDWTKEAEAMNMLDKFIARGQSFVVDINKITNLQSLINLDKTLPKLEAISVGVTPYILNMYRTGMTCCCRSLMHIGKMYAEMSDLNEQIASRAFTM